MMCQPYWFTAAALLGMILAPRASAVSTWDGGAGTDSWGDNFNWAPNFPPVGDVTIGLLPSTADALTKLNTNYSLHSLTIYRGADVINSANSGATASLLLVDDIVEISSDFGGGSSITLFGNGLDAGRISVEDGGTLNLNSQAAAGTAIARFDGGPLVVDAGGAIIGNGRIDLATDTGAEPGVLLSNDGTLTAGAFGIFLDAPVTQLQIIGNNSLDSVWLDGVGGGGVVNVNNNATLRVDTLTVQSFSGDLNLSTGGTLRIASPWTIEGGTVDVNTQGFIIGTPGPAAHLAGGAITYSGGSMTLDNIDSLTLDAGFTATGGVINNSGTITFNAAAKILAGADFNMIGGQSKLIVSNNVYIDTPDFNLDGDDASGNSTTINAGGKLELNLGAGADEEFNHAINLNGGAMRVSTADNTWSLGPGGVINANGPAVSTVDGETLQVLGSAAINVAAGGFLDVKAPTQFIGNCSVAIGPVSLDFGTVTYNHPSATYAGAGTLHSGNATVDDDTTWNVATVNLDDGNVILNDNLDIFANSIDDDGGGFGATMVINEAARFAVTIAGGGGWALDVGGTITYNGDLVDFDSYLAGSSIALNGTLNNNGAGICDARLDIGSSGHVNIAASLLVLNGGNTTTSPNTIAGGVIDGPSVLFILAGRELRGFGTINAIVAGVGTLRADNGALNLNRFETGDLLGTADDDGILNMANPWNTVQTAAVELRGGELRGAAITNDRAGGIKGHGLVSAKVINNSRIDAEKRTLRLNNPANDNDWDGASGGGQLNAVSADLELVDDATFPFTGVVAAEDGHAVFANGFDLEFQPGSTLRLTAGKFRSTHTTHFGGNATVYAGGASTLEILSATAEFENTSVTTLEDDLTLEAGYAVVHPNAQFNAAAPDASLVASSSVLRLLDGVVSGVRIENRSVVHLGDFFAVGHVTAAGYRQIGGDLAMELGGTEFNDHDTLDLTGAASLSGRLILNLINGYVPVLGQTIDILSADGGVSGKFAAVLNPSMPAGLRFEAFYKPESVYLQVVSISTLSADFDDDLDVDGADLAVWRGAFGLNDLADADGDNDSDGADFLVWQRQLGITAAPPSATAVPEPATAILFLAGCAAATVFKRCRLLRRNSFEIP